MRIIETLSAAGVHVGVMIGPVIPGLNDHELQRILKMAASKGATFAAYTFVRLNGAIQLLFRDWLEKNYPDRADKVWHLIQDGHDGKVTDSRFGIRMKGEGPMADMIAQQFRKYTAAYGLNQDRWELDCSHFALPGRQMRLF
jgi:DNA repair photolyase